MAGKLLGAMLSIVIGIAMLPTVTNVIGGLDTSTLPTAVKSLVDLLPVLFVILIVAGSVSYISFNKNK